MAQSWGPPFAVDAICFDLLTALLDSWSLWEIVAAEAGHPGMGQLWRHTALRRVTASGAYRPYQDVVAAAAEEVGLNADLAGVLLGQWHELEPWPEIPGMLSRLDKPLATATNCPEALARMSVSALGNPFAVVVSAERDITSRIHVHTC